jgi:hypothetical protein
MPQDSRREAFYLKRKWTDLPGLLAFKSPLLAYFSPLSKLLHTILYLFREQLYDYKKYSADLSDRSEGYNRNYLWKDY